MYGSARYLFIYVVTGIGAYLLSGFVGHFSIGGSGALLGLIGVLMAHHHKPAKRLHANAEEPADPVVDLHRRHGVLDVRN